MFAARIFPLKTLPAPTAGGLRAGTTKTTTIKG